MSRSKISKRTASEGGPSVAGPTCCERSRDVGSLKPLPHTVGEDPARIKTKKQWQQSAHEWHARPGLVLEEGGSKKVFSVFGRKAGGAFILTQT